MRTYSIKEVHDYSDETIGLWVECPVCGHMNLSYLLIEYPQSNFSCWGCIEQSLIDATEWVDELQEDFL